jgi:hypothetical protein
MFCYFLPIFANIFANFLPKFIDMMGSYLFGPNESPEESRLRLALHFKSFFGRKGPRTGWPDLANLNHLVEFLPVGRIFAIRAIFRHLGECSLYAFFEKLVTQVAHFLGNFFAQENLCINTDRTWVWAAHWATFFSQTQWVALPENWESARNNGPVKKSETAT